MVVTISLDMLLARMIGEIEKPKKYSNSATIANFEFKCSYTVVAVVHTHVLEHSNLILVAVRVH